MSNQPVTLVNLGPSSMSVKVRTATNSVDYIHIQSKSKVALPAGYTPDHNFMVMNPSIRQLAATAETPTPTAESNDSTDTN